MPNRRKDDPEGPKLTPGERAINWAKAFALIIPLFGAGYFSNTETVKTWITPQPEAETQAEPAKVDIPVLSCPKIDLTPLRKMIEKRCSLSNLIEDHETEFHE